MRTSDLRSRPYYSSSEQSLAVAPAHSLLAIAFHSMGPFALIPVKSLFNLMRELVPLTHGTAFSTRRQSTLQCTASLGKGSATGVGMDADMQQVDSAL